MYEQKCRILFLRKPVFVYVYNTIANISYSVYEDILFVTTKIYTSIIYKENSFLTAFVMRYFNFDKKYYILYTYVIIVIIIIIECSKLEAFITRAIRYARDLIDKSIKEIETIAGDRPTKAINRSERNKIVHTLL